MTAPPGWYGQKDGTHKYWDGEKWLDDQAPVISETPGVVVTNHATQDSGSAANPIHLNIPGVKSPKDIKRILGVGFAIVVLGPILLGLLFIVIVNVAGT